MLLFQDSLPTVNPWVPIVLTIIGFILTIGVPIVGWAFRAIHKRVDGTEKLIADLKQDMDTKINVVKEDAESKRIETRDTLLELVEAKFDAIWTTLKHIKDEVKGKVK